MVAGSDGANFLNGGAGNDTLETDSADPLITAAGDTPLANVFASLPSWIDAL